MNKENCFIVLLLLIVLGGIGGLILGWSVSEFGLWGLFVGVMMFTLSEGVVAYGFATDGSWYPGFVLHMVGAGVTLAVLLHMTDAFQEHLVFGQPFFYNISLDLRCADCPDYHRRANGALEILESKKKGHICRIKGTPT